MNVPRRRWSYSLRTLFAVVTLFACWLGYSLNWMRERQQVREWLASDERSWYAPSLAGAPLEASPPLSLRLFGEKGMVGIGMDVEQFAGPVPYSPAKLKGLFPQAQVDFSGEGVFVDE